jgi:hypothetical protein
MMALANQVDPDYGRLYGRGVTEPPDDAYGRVTNPERYRPLHAVADAVVAELVANFAVTADETPGARPESFARANVERSVLLTPEGGGAPIAVGWTTFPGVIVACGWWYHEPFPGCGCDACDEDPSELERLLRGCVDDVTSGRFQESITSDLRCTHEFPNSSGWEQLTPDQMPAGATPGMRSDWKPWVRS